MQQNVYITPLKTDNCKALSARACCQLPEILDGCRPHPGVSHVCQRCLKLLYHDDDKGVSHPRMGERRQAGSWMVAVDDLSFDLLPGSLGPISPMLPSFWLQCALSYNALSPETICCNLQAADEKAKAE